MLPCFMVCGMPCRVPTGFAADAKAAANPAAERTYIMGKIAVKGH